MGSAHPMRRLEPASTRRFRVRAASRIASSPRPDIDDIMLMMLRVSMESLRNRMELIMFVFPEPFSP